MKPITIVLTDGYSDWEIAPLAGAGRAFYGADIRFVSPSGGPVRSIAGLLVAETAIFVAPSTGVVVVCGGPALEGEVDITAELTKARATGCIIAGICGGTIAMARAGMLDEVEHTSNAPGYLQQHVAEYTGSHAYVDRPTAVRSGEIITAPAPAPASFAAAVLEAAGLEAAKATQLKGMLAQEHLA